MLLSPTRVLDDDELRRYTGQTAIRDSETAEKHAASTAAAFHSAVWAVRKHLLSFPARLLRWCTVSASTGVDAADAIILTPVFALPAGILLVAVVRPSIPTALVLSLVITVLFYCLVYSI